MKRLAMAAGADLIKLSQDDALLFTELARLGWQVETLILNCPQALWAS